MPLSPPTPDGVLRLCARLDHARGHRVLDQVRRVLRGHVLESVGNDRVLGVHGEFGANRDRHLVRVRGRILHGQAERVPGMRVA